MIGCVLLGLSFAQFVIGQTRSSFHVSCTTLVTENVDPVVLPGKVGFGHAHRVVGANGFSSRSTAVSRNLKKDPPTSIFRSSTGTTCDVPKDLSAYWQPALFYQLQSNNNLIRIKDGPAFSYYNFYKGVQNFPDHFNVIVGKPDRTKMTQTSEISSIYFEYPVGTKLYDFPKVTCANKMLRAHVFFPNCGKVDPKTRQLIKDPVTGRYVLEYPKGFRTGSEIPHVSGFDYAGTGCPAGDLVFPQIHQAFHYDLSNICSHGNILPGRFVWSNGNPDGRGLHADFLNGWEPALMNSIITQCRVGNCTRNGNGCPKNICTGKKPYMYKLKEGSYDYAGPASGSGIPPSVYLLNQGQRPNWGWNNTLANSIKWTIPTIAPIKSADTNERPSKAPTSIPTRHSPTRKPHSPPTSRPYESPSVKPTKTPTTKHPSNVPSLTPSIKQESNKNTDTQSLTDSSSTSAVNKIYIIISIVSVVSAFICLVGMYFLCRKGKVPTPIAPLLSDDPIYTENKGDLKIEKLYENESQFSLDFSQKVATQTGEKSVVSDSTKVKVQAVTNKDDTEIKDSVVRNVEPTTIGAS